MQAMRSQSSYSTLCQVSKSMFVIVWHEPSTFFTQDAAEQWALTVICACQAWLKYVIQFLRYITERDFLWCTLTSSNLDCWPRDHQSWSFNVVAPWTTCVNWLQNRFNRFQNTVSTSLVKTNKQTNEQPGQEHNGSACQCNITEA